MTTDIELLRRDYAVEVLTYEGKRISMAGRVFTRIARGQVAAIIFWFAVPSFGFGVSLIAKALRCPIVLITGGYDIADIPEIGFGSMIRPRLRRLVIGMLRMADLVLPFSDYARRDVLRYARPARLATAYPGVDVEKFHPGTGGQSERLVVTASAVGHAFVRQKGLDTFVKAAALVPDARFLVIGRFVDDAIDQLRAGAPPNVEFTGRFVSDEELVETFQRARVYVQASVHEGFGVALAEAMAAGCVPVAAPITAMPEVVGDSGFYAPVGDAAAFGAAIREALADDGRRAVAARQRIVDHFTLAHRKRVLLAEVGRLLQRDPGAVTVHERDQRARPY